MSEKQEKRELQLHKEQMQVSKKWSETANVRVYKRTYTEEKQINVPITREELIIEKKTVSSVDNQDSGIETITIPLMEERIEIILHPTVLEDVEIYNHQYKESIQIQEILKEERVRIETTGAAKVVLDEFNGEN
ncbi:YsnF/AvaK domain-containing protein [Bacillus sp. FJAT-18017]|uniref:YsnF/AvaK domain-containing protein n=1 Tax=Bacillus sp. FJAT-18017 TaxID=1705566 RepID=UPI0006B027EC|nr:YsnF/AvaK domain-containing protein [Bacillus sp. FJAT-18017]